MSDFFDSFGAGDLLSFAGDLFGASKDRKAAKNAAYLGSLRGTVDQARAVGISPIAALGYSGYSPTLIGGQSNLGSALKDVMRARAERKDSSINRRVQESQINANDALAQKYLSEAALNAQQMTPTKWMSFKASNIHDNIKASIPKRFIPVRDNKRGRVYMEANPDVYELGEALGLTVSGDARLSPRKKAKPSPGRRGRNDPRRGQR